MDRCDVAVVGGGPAGSTCAWQLARSGLDVVVLDRAAFPRDKVCAGWITPQIVASLELDLDAYARERTLQRIDGFACGVLGGRIERVPYGRTVSYAIRRCEFDDFLLRRSGARLRLDEPLRYVERIAGGWRINGDLEARLLVGAGGHFCPVARRLGADPGRDETAVYAQEAEIDLTEAEADACAIEGTRPELYFCPDLAGYGWCVRKRQRLNVGMGRLEPHRLAERLAELWTWLIETRRIPARAPPRFKGHAYLLGPLSRRRLVGERTLLVGDAAGVAYDVSGEGIRPAVESALLAARAITAARGEYAAPALGAYADALRARFGTAAPVERAAAQHPAPVPTGWRRSVGRYVLSHAVLARRWVIDRSFLHPREPALLPVTAPAPRAAGTPDPEPSCAR